MATIPTIASSFSPYWANCWITVWASTQVITLARTAKPTPIRIGFLALRWVALMPAMRAARISTRLQALAEDDDRGVGHRADRARALAQGAARAVERLVERQARVADLLGGGLLGDQVGQARVVPVAEPDQALDLGRQAGVDRAEVQLRAELEERVGLEAGLLGRVVVGSAHRGHHAIERELHQIQVGLVGALLPRLGVDRPRACRWPWSRHCLDSRRFGHGRAGGGVLDLGLELGQRRRAPSRYGSRPSSGAGSAGRRTRTRRRRGTRSPPAPRSPW